MKYKINIVNYLDLNTEVYKHGYNIFILQPYELDTINLSKFIYKPEVFWVWEFKSLPNIFLDYQNFFSKCYVPSQFCYQVFSNHLNIFVEKIVINSNIHNYLDTLHAHNIKNEMMNDILDKTSKKIKFGYVFNSNSSLVRKNVINLVKAFDSIKSRNAVLILKYIPLKNHRIIYVKMIYFWKNI